MLQTFNKNLLLLIDVEEIEGDIMEFEIMKDKIAQLQSEIIESLSKPANRRDKKKLRSLLVDQSLPQLNCFVDWSQEGRSSSKRRISSVDNK